MIFISGSLISWKLDGSSNHPIPGLSAVDRLASRIQFNESFRASCLKEPFMQIYRYKLDDADRPVARRWTLGAVGFYGSILIGLILYAALSPKADAFHASDEGTVKLSIANGPPKMASETARR